MARVTFKKNRLLKEDVSVDAESGKTLLWLAEEHGIPMGSNCGGVCGCSTCHSYVLTGFDALPEMEDAEADRLDLAFDVKLNSRLGCQAKIGDDDLTVELASESIDAFLDENPHVRRRFDETGEFVREKRHHH